MAIVKLQIGATSGSLSTIDKGLNQESIIIEREEKIQDVVNWHGRRTVNILGQRKKVFKISYENVNSTLYATVISYALTSRRWWTKIPGFGGYDIFNGFAFVAIDNEEAQRVTDTQVLYSFTLNIKEL